MNEFELITKQVWSRVHLATFDSINIQMPVDIFDKVDEINDLLFARVDVISYDIYNSMVVKYGR